MVTRKKPSSNLRLLSLDTLGKIRDNNYMALSYKNHCYGKEAIEAEIKRKLESKKYRGMHWKREAERINS